MLFDGLKFNRFAFHQFFHFLLNILIISDDEKIKENNDEDDFFAEFTEDKLITELKDGTVSLWFPTSRALRAARVSLQL